MMELIWRPLRYQLGAEELLELGRPVRVYRYAHTPFLAGRREEPRREIQAPANLLRHERNLLTRGMGQTQAPAGQTSTLTKVLIVGVPILIVVGLLAVSK